MWHELTVREQEAASDMLGYDEASWDQEMLVGDDDDDDDDDRAGNSSLSSSSSSLSTELDDEMTDTYFGVGFRYAPFCALVQYIYLYATCHSRLPSSVSLGGCLCL